MCVCMYIYIYILTYIYIYTLFDPVDCSQSGFSVHRISQAVIHEGLPFPTPWDPPTPGLKPMSLVSAALAGGFFFITSATWKAIYIYTHMCMYMYASSRSCLFYYTLFSPKTFK